MMTKMISWGMTFSLICCVGNLGAQMGVHPVEEQTITVNNGFNYVGLRVHEIPAAESTVVAVTPGSKLVSIADGVVESLDIGKKYLFEVDSGKALGAVIEIAAFNAASDTVTLGDDLSSDLTSGDQFTIRPVATLASIFGANNSVGLDGAYGPDSAVDLVILPNGTGGFDRYYYSFFSPVTFGPAWMNASTGTVVDPHGISIYYPGGMIILGGGRVNSLLVCGTAKLTPTNYVLTAGFNYLSTIYPTGSTLATLFGGNNSAGLMPGNGSSTGADQIWIPDSTGGFKRYYYDNFSTVIFAPAWSDASNNSVVDPTTVSFDGKSGIIILNDGGVGHSVTAAPPGFYLSL